MLGLDYIKRANIAFQGIENTPQSVCRHCQTDLNDLFKRCNTISKLVSNCFCFKVVITFTYNLQTNKKARKQTNKHTNKQTHTQTGRQTDRQTDIQTNKQTKTNQQSNKLYTLTNPESHWRNNRGVFSVCIFKRNQRISNTLLISFFLSRQQKKNPHTSNSEVEVPAFKVSMGDMLPPRGLPV